MSKFGTLLLCLVLFAGAKLSAQITITESDVQNFVNINNTLDVTVDTTTTSLDIGMTGSTSWDFSGLSSDFESTFTSIDPSGTPFTSAFPSATNCFNGTVLEMGYELESWQYLGIDNGLLTYGYAAQGNAGGFTLTAVISNNPAEKTVVVPLTMGSSWSEDYVETDSTVLAPLPPIVSVYNIHKENMVDAYGPMTLPGGGMVDALRIRTYETSTGSGGTVNSVSYMFLSKTGTQISVNAADTTSTGVIPVDPDGGITYINSSVVGIRQADNTLPENFMLDQNYPNPFNPTTQINYSIPSAQKVVLKVYDALGRDVATLVNDQQAAGNYTVDFNAVKLASGIYFYRLQAGDFVQMKKMILMK